MDAAPETNAKVRFQEMLAAYQAGMASVQPAARPAVNAPRAAWFPVQPVWQLAAAAGLLVGGILFGHYLPLAGGGNPEMAQLRAQIGRASCRERGQISV